MLGKKCLALTVKHSYLLIAFILLISLFSQFAYSTDSANAEDAIATKLELRDKISHASIELSSFFYGVDKSDMVIVTGSKISVEDKMVFRILQSEVDEASGIMTMADKDAINSKAINGKTLILLGSEKTNYLGNKILSEGNFTQYNESVYEPLVLKYGVDENGNKILFVFSQKEILNNENRAVKASPLNSIMDEKYVPVAATSTSIVLLYLWSIFGNALIGLFSDYASSKVADKALKSKKISERKKLHNQKTLKIHELMHSSEIIALIISIIIFALTVAWTWTDSLKNFWSIFFMSVIIVTIISVMKEIIRQSFCYKRKIAAEYLLWPFGSAVTLISTYLGNTFSLAAYGIVEDTDADEKKFGKISLWTCIFTLVIAILAYIANIIHPSLMLQLIGVYAIMTTFIDMFPLAPMSGADMRKWNFPVWIILYVIVIACYIFMNFTTYI